MTELIVPSLQQVRQYARGALSAADALEAAPVPIDDIVDAVGLHQENLFTLGEENLPPRMLAIARKFSSRILGAMAVKEKVLYVDESLVVPRKRFTQAHEVGHKALPWHEDAYYVDSKTTLDPTTRVLLEQEANAFAAEVLFGLDRFTEEADSFAPSLAAALEVSKRYAASGHAGLRRYAETSQHPVALIALGQFPLRTGKALKVFPAQCASSRSFSDRYGHVTSLLGGQLPVLNNPAVAELARMQTRVHDETFELVLDTRRGLTRFRAQLFFNNHLRFMLLTRRSILGRRIRAVNQPSGS